MWVHNINGSSKRSPNCKCGSWKQHWLKFSGAKEWPTFCSVITCINHAEDGGHVQLKPKGDWYIVPLCKSCNGKHGQSLEVSNGTLFAPADRASTCGLSR